MAIVKRTDEAFSEVTTSVSKASVLVSEITAASIEQAQGIEQINTAVVEMGKVTQQNAAGAQESAAASEEMNNQATLMKEYIDVMTSLANGRSSLREKPSRKMPEHQSSAQIASDTPDF